MTWKSVIVKYNNVKDLAVRNIVNSDSFQPFNRPLNIKIISVKIQHPTSHPEGTIGILSSNKITSFEQDNQSIVKNFFCPLAFIDLHATKGETKLVNLNLPNTFIIDSGESVCLWISDDSEKRIKHDCKIDVLINYEVLK